MKCGPVNCLNYLFLENVNSKGNFADYNTGINNSGGLALFDMGVFEPSALGGMMLSKS